jgi:predicted CxxxxCH...CXXCH cytochrome family protein
LKNDLPTATEAGPQIHGQGWTDTASTNFHGIAIQNAGWRLTGCQKCHGMDYRGGSAQSSCLTCHTKSGGPENCILCHGGSNNAAPPNDLAGNTATSFPGVGTHQSHVAALDTIALAIACSECHTMPTAFNSPGHIDSTAGAEVVFNGAILHEPLALKAVGTPNYSRTTLTCQNTYCHGNFPNGNNISPVWNNVSGQYHACGSCHGDVTKSTIAEKALPKTSLTGGTHPNDLQCSKCHGRVIDTSYRLISNRHVNGRID